MHALIVGDRGVGKSTLIRRVLKALDRPLFGYETKKESALEIPGIGCPVYIYEAGTPHRQTPENFLGYNTQPDPEQIRAAFDRYAPKLTAPVPAGCVIELDEIGFLEARSEAFCNAVLQLLDGSTPVIAAVKTRDIPFLNRIRQHPNARCFTVTPENRDALYEEVLSFMQQQLEDRL